MTAREMQIEFERRLLLINPALTSIEKIDSDTIFSFLNAYTLRYTQQMYSAGDNVQIGSRANNLSIDTIGGLLTKTELTNDSGLSNVSPQFETWWNVPNDYFLYVRSTSKVTGGAQTTAKQELVLNMYVSELLMNNVETHVYNKTIVPYPAITQIAYEKNNVVSDTKFKVIADVYTTVNAVTLYYYRKPKKFNVIGVDEQTVLSKCELPEPTHMSIVEGAVEMFITENKYRLSNKQTSDNNDTN